MYTGCAWPVGQMRGGEVKERKKGRQEIQFFLIKGIFIL